MAGTSRALSTVITTQESLMENRLENIVRRQVRYMNEDRFALLVLGFVAALFASPLL